MASMVFWPLDARCFRLSPKEKDYFPLFLFACLILIGAFLSRDCLQFCAASLRENQIVDFSFFGFLLSKTF